MRRALPVDVVRNADFSYPTGAYVHLDREAWRSVYIFNLMHCSFFFSRCFAREGLILRWELHLAE